MALSHQDLAARLDELEAKTDNLTLQHESFSNLTRKQLKDVFDVLRQLTTPTESPKRPIGFINHEDKKSAAKKQPLNKLNFVDI
jgi:hypothetical protein